jgi:hypothetical protein
MRIASLISIATDIITEEEVLSSGKFVPEYADFQGRGCVAGHQVNLPRQGQRKYPLCVRIRVSFGGNFVSGTENKFLQVHLSS